METQVKNINSNQEDINSLIQSACGKRHVIEVDHSNKGYLVKGILLNYNSGNVVMSTDDGIWHIKREDINFMRPIL